MGKPFTGRHMTAILVGAFAVVLSVNLALARLASSTFGGEVVENSYVASQDFNRWLDEAAASKALGWTARPARQGDGRLVLFVDGVPPDATAKAVARHPLGQEADRALAFRRVDAHRFVSTAPLPAGRWTLRIALDARAREWRGEAQVR